MDYSHNYSRCKICGDTRLHGGDKALAAKHSKETKRLMDEERARHPHVDDRPPVSNYRNEPFIRARTKTNAKILL